MPTVARSFIGAGTEFTSDAVAHAGGKAQLIVFGSPESGGSDCRVTLLKEVASPVSAYKELSYVFSEGEAVRIELEACNLKFKVSPQSEYSNFAVELTTK